MDKKWLFLIITSFLNDDPFLQCCYVKVSHCKLKSNIWSFDSSGLDKFVTFYLYNDDWHNQRVYK